MTQGKICFITFLKKRRHDWHLVNSRSNWDHFKNWEQTPSDFWPQIQAKIGSSSLSSNKLVLITWFCNHQMIFNFSESLLIFRSQLAPSVQPQRFVAVFITKYFAKKPPWSIIYIEMYTQLSQFCSTSLNCKQHSQLRFKNFLKKNKMKQIGTNQILKW